MMTNKAPYCVLTAQRSTKAAVSDMRGFFSSANYNGALYAWFETTWGAKRGAQSGPDAPPCSLWLRVRFGETAGQPVQRGVYQLVAVWSRVEAELAGFHDAARPAAWRRIVGRYPRQEPRT